MTQIDSVSQYQQTSVLPTGGDKIATQRAGTEKLPQDVLEAMMDGNIELAMLRLQMYKGLEEKPEGVLNRFIALFPKMFSVFFNFFPAATAPQGVKKARPEPSQPIALKAAVVLKQVGKFIGVGLFTPIRVAIEGFAIAYKAVTYVQKEVFVPIANTVKEAVVQVARVAYKPIEKRLEKALEVGRAIYEKTIEPIKEKVAEKIKEFVEEAKEIARPVKEWMSRRFDEVVLQKEFVIEALGAQIVHVQKVADFVFQIAAFTLVPALMAKKRIEKMLKRVENLKKGLMMLGQFFKKQAAKGHDLVKKSLRAAAFATERVIKGLWKMFLAFLRNLWQKFISYFKVVRPR